MPFNRKGARWKLASFRAVGLFPRSLSLRMLALLAVGTGAFAGSAGAAEIIYAPYPAVVVPWGIHYPERGARRWARHAPDELIAGVRGNFLAVPFFGYGWVPGPARYYGPRPRPCCHAGQAVISVRY